MKVNEEEYLGLGVYVNNPSGSSYRRWSCQAWVEVRLINQKDGSCVAKHFDHKFWEEDPTKKIWNLERWSDVVDVENGFYLVS